MTLDPRSGAEPAPCSVAPGHPVASWPRLPDLAGLGGRPGQSSLEPFSRLMV